MARYKRISEDEECDPLRSGDLLPCAYLRTAAVLTCLHIPMQLNIVYFSFSALAPSLPAFPFHPLRAMNADKRYPLAWLLPCASESKNAVNYVCKDRDYLERMQILMKISFVFNEYCVILQPSCGCSVMAARKTSDLDSAYLQCAGAGSIPVTRSDKYKKGKVEYTATTSEG